MHTYIIPNFMHVKLQKKDMIHKAYYYTSYSLLTLELTSYAYYTPYINNNKISIMIYQEIRQTNNFK